MTAELYKKFYDDIASRLGDAPADMLDAVSHLFRAAKTSRKKVILAGNGGSAAIASHVSVDLTKAAGIRSVCFNESDLITCFANDYGYEHWLGKALDAYGDPGDVAVLVSSSGRSPNIVNAARAAKAAGLSVVTLSGFDANNPLRTLGDHNLWLDSSSYNVVETVHQIWLLACVEGVCGDQQ